MTANASATDSATGAATIYRLDLPADLAEPLARDAELNERTLPGQIRFALRQWLASRNG
jgi:hypothetical protein